MTILHRPAALDSRSALGALLVLVAMAAAFTTRPAPTPQSADSPDRAGPPVSFVANHGQAAAPVRYHAAAPGISTFFTQDKVVMALRDRHALELRFVGAAPDARIVADERRRGRVNYFTGDESHTGIPTFGRITYRDLWPGIDLAFHARHGLLKYEFRLAAGADPDDIRLAFAGADALTIRGGGDLAVRTAAGTLVDTAPRSHQPGGSRVESRFALRGRRSYGFALGPYDRTRPLVIDPSLEYSTYLGGSGGCCGDDRAEDIAVDGSGSAYVVSINFPTTPGAFDRSLNSPFSDVAVTKLSPDGTRAEYSTFIGGSQQTANAGISVDALGHAYITGATRPGFPTTPGAFNSGDGEWDAFLTKLSPDGSALVYSARLGGNGLTYGKATAVDADGNAYVAGDTNASEFPTTAGAFDRTLGGDYDAFVSKLSADGSTLVYSTLIGTSLIDVLEDMAIDASGSAYITGTTRGADFPTTPGAFDTAGGGFVTKLNPSGADLAYSGRLGGGPLAIDVDGAGAAYVAGRTSNAGYPTTEGAFDRTYGGDLDAFVTKIAPDGTALEYSTFLGAGSADQAFGIAVDSLGRALVTGQTVSDQFPLTPDAFDQTESIADAFVTVLDPDGSALVYSTFLGGSVAEETREGAAWDDAGNAYVSGSTRSQDFPTTPGAFDRHLTGFEDGFVAKFDLGPGPPARLDLSPETATNTLDEDEHCVTATVTDIAADPTEGVTVTFTVTGTTSASGSATTNEDGEAPFCYDAPELPGGDDITATVSASGPSDTATKTWIVPETTDGCRITGGGRIDTDDRGRATFSFSPPIRTSGSVKGRVRYRSTGHAGHLTVISTEIDAATCKPGSATIFGRAGSVAFRVDVQDGGRGGGPDTFRILLSSGYDSGAHTLLGGNVVVRD